MNSVKSLLHINYLLIGSFALLFALWIGTYITNAFDVYSGILSKYDVLSKPYLIEYVVGVQFINKYLVTSLFWCAVFHALIGILLQHWLRDYKYVERTCIVFGYAGVVLALFTISFVMVFILKPFMPFYL
ncbi:hypothetical protein [Motilimonas sp. KMU-193]|uniref:hypothetical protein n=1 Tax=Motilimonas sp. KMU-193 TaxID=3388668 RepID=UPI00396B0705